MEKKTSIEFAFYRLNRAKQEHETAELLYKENKLLAAKVREDSDYERENFNFPY